MDDLINLELLKQPVSDEFPAGEDLRNDVTPTSPYFSLKDVRNNARAAERNALVENEPLLSYSAKWKDILTSVPNILTTQCKDLEFAAWYIEALARNYGFAGLNCGFTVAKILIEEFWEYLYPLPDEDGIETRIAPLIGLNGVEGEGTLIIPISCVPITEVHTEQAFSLWEYEQALEIERLDSDRKKQRIGAGGIELKDVLAAAEASSAAFYQQLYRDIESAIDSYTELVKVMDDKCEVSLPTSHISKRLQSCLDAVVYLAGAKLNDDESSGELDNLETENEKQSDTTVATLSVQLNSRQEAIKSLKQIADFFKQTEPHSPMAYAIEQVVRWSDMALPDLLAELISDNEARNGYFRLVGIAKDNNE
ncbi:type VI secretion system protein TssA [Photobacterium sp. J15]|uniref:type VI secretion system protein TssA n=1 Tax=Photobacterium sp. J15 TaxID=265901 RepID=UPI0007E336B8|nr:type VI secretion system protein TssA [Photobacterium sp. J15]